MRKRAAVRWLGLAVLAMSSVAAAGTPSLVDAAKSGDGAAVQALLEQSVDVNAPDVTGATALHWAAHRDDVALVDQLLQAGANASAVNKYGVTPMLLAAENGNATVIERLLRAGADANEAFPGGETALMTAARAGNAKAVSVLIEAGADVNAREESRGQTALMWAGARNGAEAVRVLVKAGADLTIRTSNASDVKLKPYGSVSDRVHPPMTGFTALLFAVRAGSLDAVRALLDTGADPNDTASGGESALVVATANAHWEVADLLLDRGADPNAAGAGWNALHQTIRVRRMNVGYGTPGPLPTGNVDSLDLIKKMIAKGIDVNQRMSKHGLNDGQRNRFNRLGSTAFLLAAKNSDVEVMNVLLAAGADATIPTAEGATPLMMAAGLHLWNPGEDSGSLPGQEAENLEAVKLCVAAGNDVNAADYEGSTALHAVAINGNVEVAKFLIAQGAKLDVKDVRGWTPLAVANGFTYTDFYKAQPHVAAVFRKEMEARGMSTEGHVIPASVCFDCITSRPQQEEHDRKLAEEYAARNDRQAKKNQ